VWFDVMCTGVWRLLTCRYSKRTNQMVLMLCVSTKGVEAALWAAAEAELTAMLQGLTNADVSTSSGADGGASGHFVRGLCVQVVI
jgi:hypothetical protein